MKEHNERYEFQGESVNGAGHPDAFIVDVVAKRDKDEFLPMKKEGLLICGPDEGEGLEHDCWFYLEFDNLEALKQAQMALELLQDAIERRNER